MAGLLTLLRIPVPEELYLELNRQADAAKKPVEYLIAERLGQIATSNSVKPLVITDENRRKLEAALGKNFSTPEELVRMVSLAMTVSVGEANIPINPTLLFRLQSRCFGMPFDKFIELTVTRALEEYCGMR